MKKHFPNKTNGRKKNLVRKERAIASEMKTMGGLMRFFPEEKKKTVNERR